MSEGLAERDRVRDLLGKVVSPEVATELLRKDVVLGGEEREVTVLFSDLRNFTGLCENAFAAGDVGILNRYFTRMMRSSEKHGGVVDKYMGDALMALFGAPLANPDNADRAMNAALEMGEALGRLESAMGTARIAHYQRGHWDQHRLRRSWQHGIGDSAQLHRHRRRCESGFAVGRTNENSGVQTRIIISGSTLAGAGRQYRTRRLGKVTVKGKQKSTEIFALLGLE